MEWVETTGDTIETAKEAALDELGVDEQDAEFEIVDEPKTGLFGRVRVEARVRARVRPTRPRPRQERRGRRNPAGRGGADRPAGTGGAGGDHGDGAGRDRAEIPSGGTTAGASTAGGSSRRRGGGRARSAVGDDATDRTPVAAAAGPTNGKASSVSDTTVYDDDATVEQQADIITTFLEGLLDAFGAHGVVQRIEVDPETIELRVEGDDLGLLIGPKGQTLTAVQELSRTVVQRRAAGTHYGRVRIDIGGYRQHRREALARFAAQVAESVLESGVQKALEPMAAADRKAVHDAINEIGGVSTVSEGDEPRRRVVIIPADA
ncbi:hypothetical protein BH24ACT3_BH24ACT3_18360 [soil metagenome]